MINTKAQARVPATVAEKVGWLDELLASEDLSATAKLVAVRLFRHHNDETGRCDPHQETIATGIGRSLRAVSRAVTELREAGWIEVHARRERADYVLVIARTETAEGVEPRQKRPASYAKSGVAGTPEMACLVRQTRRTEPPTLTTKKTTHLTEAPPEAASAPVPPLPVNDNLPVGDGETFSGWTIPGETLRQWVATFTDLNVRDELQRRARWYVANVPEERRLRVFEGKLRQWNKEARESRLSRTDAKVADAEAGIERCPFTGRNLTLMRSGAKSRFQV